MDKPDKETEGAWIIHHGRKIALDVSAAPEFPVLDEAAKAAELLIRLGQSDSTTLTTKEVQAVASSAHLNPRTELPHFLGLLQNRRLIDCSDKEVRVLGVTNRATLAHASDIMRDAGPNPFEQAAIDLAELTSDAPQTLSLASEFIADRHRLAKADAKDFMQRSLEIGFVDCEGERDDALLFNGNLFRKDTVRKAQKVLGSLSSDEQRRIVEFDEQMKRGQQCLLASVADKVLGPQLFEKLKAAGLYDVNNVSNEYGEHAFVTSPGAFHKYVNPMVADSFDLAKALVSAISYGMTLRHASQGRIVSAQWILGALIAGRTIGPATAIGKDYRVLEESRVVQTYPDRFGFSMRLLKREIGELALEVLTTGDANAEALTEPPAAPMTGYKGPEQTRVRVRRTQGQASKRATREILSVLRGGRSI